MGKEEICNMDCLHCVHPDCINERPMTRKILLAAQGQAFG